MNLYSEVFLENEKVSIDSLQVFILKERYRREGFSAKNYEQFEVFWDTHASKDTVSQVLSEMYSAMKIAYDEKSTALFNMPICNLDSAEFSELRPENFSFVFEKTPPPPHLPIHWSEEDKAIDLYLDQFE